MVATDGATYWDFKPNREGMNKVFNMLCNVQPVEHPWTGSGYSRDLDVKYGFKEQFRLEKCKGLKKCDLYHYKCSNSKLVVKDSDDSKFNKYEELWSNSNFTDVINFQGHRFYMRKLNSSLKPYGRYEDEYIESGGDNNENTCDEGNRPSNTIKNLGPNSSLTNEDESKKFNKTYGASDRIRIYVQNVDTTGCSGDTFEEADNGPIVLIKEYEAAECNPDHFITGYGGIGTPTIYDDISISLIIYQGYIYAYIAAAGNIPEVKEDKGMPKASELLLGNTYQYKGITYRDYEQNNYKFRRNYFYKCVVSDPSAQVLSYTWEEHESIVEYIGVDDTDSIYFPELGIYAQGVLKYDSSELFKNIVSFFNLPEGGYFLSSTAEMMTVMLLPEVNEGSQGAVNTITGQIQVFKDYGEIPFFAAGSKIIGINGLFYRNDYDCDIPNNDELDEVIYDAKTKVKEGCIAKEPDYQDRRMFLFDSELIGGTGTTAITGLAKRGDRLTYVSDGKLFVSGNGTMNGIFAPDLSQNGDVGRGPKTIPSGLTDVISMGNSILLLGPRDIYFVQTVESLVGGIFIKATEGDGYYCPGSYCVDDSNILIARRGKIFETMVCNAYYGTTQFEEDTGFYINHHIQELDNRVDYIGIDSNINNIYISIYDNYDIGKHYSKLIIYDKHYKFWYHWVIDGARIVKVKDGIFLGDGVYVNKGRTRGRKEKDTDGSEIIEIISLYVGEEGLQTPKHIQYMKTAVGYNSVITNNSYRDIITTFGGKRRMRRNNITTTRYPNLLPIKDKDDVIDTYQDGSTISGNGKREISTFQRGITGYRDYNKYSNVIHREMGEDIDYTSNLGLYASIKEPINTPANVIEVSISARYIDSVEFGSLFISYYVLDADHEDIENTNIDISGFSDKTKPLQAELNRGEYCEEVLQGSACDVTYDDNILNSNQ